MNKTQYENGLSSSTKVKSTVSVVYQNILVLGILICAIVFSTNSLNAKDKGSFIPIVAEKDTLFFDKLRRGKAKIPFKLYFGFRS